MGVSSAFFLDLDLRYYKVVPVWVTDYHYFEVQECLDGLLHQINRITIIEIDFIVLSSGNSCGPPMTRNIHDGSAYEIWFAHPVSNHNTEGVELRAEVGPNLYNCESRAVWKDSEPLAAYFGDQT